MKVSGNLLHRGVEVPSLKRDVKWHFNPTAKVGDEVQAGDIIGTVQESKIVLHKIMVPYGISGKITSITEGDYTVTEVVAKVQDEKGQELSLIHS